MDIANIGDAANKVLGQNIPCPVDIPMSGVSTFAPIVSVGGLLPPIANRTCLRSVAFINFCEANAFHLKLVTEKLLQRPKGPIRKFLIGLFSFFAFRVPLNPFNLADSNFADIVAGAPSGKLLRCLVQSVFELGITLGEDIPLGVVIPFPLLGVFLAPCHQFLKLANLLIPQTMDATQLSAC